MKTMFEHIEQVKGKPHHIRHQIAFGIAGACTAVIALVWLAGSVGTGVFALKDTSFAQSTGKDAPSIVSGNAAHEQFAGVGAASTVFQKTSVPAHIEIIDSVSSAASLKKVEQTIIPF